MKKITFLLCGLFLFAGLGIAQTPTQLKENEAEVTFSVNVDCNNCKKKIENSMPHEKGVVDMKASVKDRQVWIKYRSDRTNKDLLRKAIEKLGYSAVEKTKDDEKTPAS
jgi:copper chaperone CopZ